MEQGLVDISKLLNQFWSRQGITCLFILLSKLAGLSGEVQAKETTDSKTRIGLRHLESGEQGQSG